MKILIVFFLISSFFIHLNGQLKRNNIKKCDVSQTTDFQELKYAYQNIVIDEYKKILTESDDKSQNEFEIILLERGDNSKGSLTTFKINSNNVFGYKKYISATHYLSMNEKDIIKLNKNLGFIKNKFYDERCMNISQHSKINILIIKKEGKIISGYASYNSSNLQTKEESEDLLALKAILSIIYQNSFLKFKL